MNEKLQINAPNIDTRKIIEQIEATVADKMQKGLYGDPKVARAERANISNLKNEDDFHHFYMECLHDAVFVDISDFEIHERRTTFSRLFVGLKSLIWKLLKFYTYRLWSQQNQVNGLLLSAVENTENRYRDKIKELERKIEELEKKINKP